MSIFRSPSSTGTELQNTEATESSAPSQELQFVEKLNCESEEHWASKLKLDNTLKRSLVSFQANKGRAVYRWFKCKEAFSAVLIEYLMNKYRISGGGLHNPIPV